MSDEENAQLRERLARIEETQEAHGRRMDIVQGDIRAIRSVLDQLNGGKKLIFAIFALIGAVAAFVGVDRVSRGG